jgi:anhydro-N-acetylmuramic acid kinase
MKVAGIMSGTSLDGIDVAIVEVGTRAGASLLAFHTTPYPIRVREALLEISNSTAHTSTIARLHFLLGELYTRAVIETCRRSRIALDSISLIGCHGQTIFHEGTPVRFLRHTVASTLQIGEASVIAERTGIPVVSDFRTRDIAAGGRGAPLVPFVDFRLFRDRRLGRVALNLGGIANITAIPANSKPRDIFGFDTGPGNMVIDALAERHTNGRWRYDHDGWIARCAGVNRDLLRDLLADRYYRLKPPKTAGREQYGPEFVARLIATGLPLPDLVATATALTAAAVAEGIARFVRPRMAVDELIVSGGGAHNPEIMKHLAAFLPGVAVCTSSDYGVDVDAKEAVAFAILAFQTWRRRPSNVPSATGARRCAVLGKVTPGNNYRGPRVT